MLNKIRLLYVLIMLLLFVACYPTQRFDFPELIPETSTVVKQRKFLNNKFIYYYEGSFKRDFVSIPKMFEDANWSWVKCVKIENDSTFSLKIKPYMLNKYDLAGLINYYVFADIHRTRVPFSTSRYSFKDVIEDTDSTTVINKSLYRGSYMVNCDVEDIIQEAYTWHRDSTGCLIPEVHLYPGIKYTLYFYDDVGKKTIIRKDIKFK